jgi:hypothetical protein
MNPAYYSVMLDDYRTRVELRVDGHNAIGDAENHLSRG